MKNTLFIAGIIMPSGLYFCSKRSSVQHLDDGRKHYRILVTWTANRANLVNHPALPKTDVAQSINVDFTAPKGDTSAGCVQGQIEAVKKQFSLKNLFKIAMKIRNQDTRNKKIAVCFLLFLAPLVALAQPDRIPVSQIENFRNEQFKRYFNSDSVRVAFQADPRYGVSMYDSTGLFIMYKKADTLDFNNPFFSVDTPFNSLGSTSDDYILEGLAYYEKEGDSYKKLFANDAAFFCSTCNNMMEHSITINHDTATISISWGPQATQGDEYTFVYRHRIKRWQLTSILSGGSDDMDYNTSTYVAYNTGTSIFLDNDDAEDLASSAFPGLSKNKGIAHFITLGYASGAYNEFLKDLKKIPAKNYELISKVFTADDATYLTRDDNENNNITSKNVVAANNVGYFLEQANALSPAQVILDSVITKFPYREVAYLNLGDVYKKQNDIPKAVKMYEIYIRLMEQRNMRNKIPERVKSFIKENEK